MCNSAILHKPFAAAHSERGAAWLATADAVREAAKATDNPYVRRVADRISVTNLKARIKLLRQTAKEKRWTDLRRSGSDEEYSMRTQKMEALDELMTNVEQDRANNADTARRYGVLAAENGKAFQQSLFHTAGRAGALAAVGKANAARLGVRDHTVLKTSTKKCTKTAAIAALDTLTDQQRTTRDLLTSVEEQADKAIKAVESAVAAEEKEREKQQEEREKQQEATNSLLRELVAAVRDLKMQVTKVVGGPN